MWEALPGGARGKECLPVQETQETPVQSLGQGKIPWNRKSQPEPVLLSRKSHGQRNLAGYSLWGQRESDMIQQLSTQVVCNPPDRQDVKLAGNSRGRTRQCKLQI